MTDELTPDGYRIVKPVKPMFGDAVEKGIQCGVCGMKFEHNKAMGYYCPHTNCPVFLKAT